MQHRCARVISEQTYQLVVERIHFDILLFFAFIM
jgi:hypothetical protein